MSLGNEMITKMQRYWLSLTIGLLPLLGCEQTAAPSQAIDSRASAEPIVASDASSIAKDMLSYQNVRLNHYRKLGINDPWLSGRPYLERIAPEKISTWRSAASNGDIDAQFLCGMCQYFGIACSADENSGAKEIYKAALAGQFDAQFTILIYGRIAELASPDISHKERWDLAIPAMIGDHAETEYAIAWAYKNGKYGDFVFNSSNQRYRSLLDSASQHGLRIAREELLALEGAER